LPGTINETALEVTRRGGHGVAVACDHSDDAMVRALFERIDEQHGKLDVLVNSAATLETKADRLHGKPPEFWNADITQWDMYHGVGLRSHYVCSAYAAKVMAKRQAGLIVNVSSAGAVQYFRCVAYGAAKAALDKMTADTAIELRRYGVSVVSIWPGLTRTEMTGWMAETGLLDISVAETPVFSGRCVVALATDPHVMHRSGKAFYVADLAEEYGFTDADGSVPKRPDMSKIVPKKQP
jgi:dehydrogenase/reductase SDR family protein 1